MPETATDAAKNDPSHGTITLPGSEGFARLLANVRAGAAERERDRILPFDAVVQQRKARLRSLRLPVSEGGGGLSLRAFFAAVIELGAADANVAHILRNHAVFVERYAQPWTGTAGAFWRREIAKGAIVGLAAPEPSTHNVGRIPLDTRLTPDSTGWRISGTKSYSTGSLYADFIAIRAMMPDDGYAMAIVPTRREGV
ncbi:MAG TPA: hypothetical protein VGC31_02405, partial [Paenirhodobacter sp.]